MTQSQSGIYGWRFYIFSWKIEIEFYEDGALYGDTSCDNAMSP